MIWVLTGTLSFGFLVLFDYQKARRVQKSIQKNIQKSMQKQKSGRNPWFLTGFLMLVFSCVMLGWSSGAEEGPSFMVGLILLAGGIGFYSRVLAVGAPDDGYRQDKGKVPVCRTGLYGQVRHPGVWSFLLCALGFGIAFPEAMGPALWFAFLNLIYTWLQDRFFFPVYLEGYDTYRKEVPYLLPRRRPSGENP